MYKSLTSTIKDIDKQGRIVVAANAFGNVDAHKDVSMSGSFSKTLREDFSRVRWFLNHDREKLLGVPLEAVETANHLQITGQLNLSKDIGRDTYADYMLYAEYGKSLEHSIGVDFIKGIDDQGVRKVTEWKLWEYSTLTSWGANERTPMLAMKSNDPLKSIEWMTLQLKSGNYTDEKFKQIDSALSNLLKSLQAETESLAPVVITDLKDISTTFINSLNK